MCCELHRLDNGTNYICIDTYFARLYDTRLLFIAVSHRAHVWHSFNMAIALAKIDCVADVLNDSSAELANAAGSLYIKNICIHSQHYSRLSYPLFPYPEDCRVYF